ncbi:27201_t:CDS:2, partial [Dentiscutata erythropus]
RFSRGVSSIITPNQPDLKRGLTKYGGKYTITLIPGDGIGQETANAVKTIFKAANVPVEWEQLDVTGYTQEDDILFEQSVQ